MDKFFWKLILIKFWKMSSFLTLFRRRRRQRRRKIFGQNFYSLFILYPLSTCGASFIWGYRGKIFFYLALKFKNQDDQSCLKGIVTLVTCYNNFKFKTKFGHRRRRRMRPSRTHYFLDSLYFCFQSSPTHNFT